MSNPKNDICFSIIVPVYNVEAYLKQCLDSILCQEYSRYELILINDGSTDSSFEICRDYQQKYSKINLINKINGGLSDARNTGLLAASGDYIIFTDSDDYWVGDTVLKDLNELIETTNPDIIIHEELRFFSSKDIVCKNNQQFIQNKKGEFENEILNLIYYDLYVASAWDKIIKRSILLDNKLFFPLERKSEDIEWCGKLIKHLKTFSIYSKSFYTYRQARKGSITTTVNEKHINDVYLMVKNGLNSEPSQSNPINEAIENYWACNYVVILKDFYVLSSKKRKEIKEDIVSWQYLLQRGRNLKIDSVMKFYQYLDFKTLIFLLNIYRIKTFFSKKYRTLRS
ncbi:glycosyltransferase family A protein [Flavobacterium sp. Fl-77]|uniref:Glycosyltransferase family A protein n=1 Tax=Flavobacterium flavipigmentatum TaxID=2893884 RepID=A0AAJ2SCZ5_9FLAO|nr:MULTISPECIES: glycosyltransferase family A protein [unclassified Flavobacterium]MDX6180979.1 glycosyltransferase family A protein [Flavobacterium sp. Fl-33]MDX6184580.1 glycosyltransferase family A protein [Flavobacterium sp. Fl-77]UFH39684.1 glycosyltransferase family 2 protein [Flavobacterium sp. F-70]